MLHISNTRKYTTSHFFFIVDFIQWLETSGIFPTYKVKSKIINSFLFNNFKYYNLLLWLMGGKYYFQNILGSFVFDQQFNLIEKGSKEKLLKKYKKLEEPEGKELVKVLEFFRDKKYFNEFYEKNVSLTKKGVKDSVTNDLLIIQTINSIEDLDKINNMLIKRLREWYSLYNPERSHSVQDHRKFVEIVLKKTKEKTMMGAELSQKDLKPVMELADKLNKLYELRKNLEKYLDGLINEVCPNVVAIAGSLIAAKLLEHAGSLKKLVMFPASTVQLLGAEKALFRHMKSGARAPKYGILFQHPLIQKNKKDIHGKIARTLADKISLAARVDYFKGKFIGDKLMKEIEDKFT